MDEGAIEGARAALERLCRERREDYANLSRLLGRNPAYIQQFVRRGTPRRLDERDRRRLAAYFQVPESVLGAPDEPEPSGGLVPVPRLSIGASAGPGALPGAERPATAMAFDARQLRALGAGRPGDLSIIGVEGDSMLPTLAPGDDILVDRGDAGRRLRDGVYVLRHEEVLIVKRVLPHPFDRRRATIKSDNRAYPSWPDCSLDDVHVVGRVIWAGRRVE